MKLIIDYKKQEFGTIGEDDFTIEMKPLNVLSFQKIMMFMREFQKEGQEVSDIGFQQLSSEKFAKICEDVIPLHCRNIKGIYLEENGESKEATIKDMISYGAFLRYNFEVIMRLISISTLSKENADLVKKQ